MGQYRYHAKAIRIKSIDDHKVDRNRVYITDPGGHPRVCRGQTMHQSHAEGYEMELDIDECHAVVPESGQIVSIPGLGNG